MCGIAGILNSVGTADPSMVEAMCTEMRHRGPDGGSVWGEDAIALGHRRLSIIDLSDRARQPMVSRDGRYVLTFNGEIYNYETLRCGLQNRGVKFKSTSDSEVLLEGLAADGKGFLQKLNGIFAFALWDRKRRVLLVTRDPVGVKPVYWAKEGGCFRFASEIKAILASGYAAEFSQDHLMEYLLFGSVAGGATLFRGVHLMEPGTWLEVKSDGDMREGTFLDLWETVNRVDLSSQEAASLVREGLETSVRRQVVSDAPVGTMCSGGLDSSIVTALSSQLIGDITSYCVAISEPSADESSFGRTVASHCGTRHFEIVSSPSDLVSNVGTAIWLHDDPLTHPNSIPILQIAMLAQKHVKVLLSGEGADEIFGGYSRYRRYLQLRKIGRGIPRCFPFDRLDGFGARIGRGGFDSFVRGMAELDGPRQLAKFRSFASDSSAQEIAPGFPITLDARMLFAEQSLAIATDDPLLAILVNDQKTHLQTLLMRQDKMCMGASVEGRVPFLDIDLVSCANSLPSRMKINGSIVKHILRNATADLLPEEISTRPKYPFGLPLSAWLPRSVGGSEPLVKILVKGELAREGVFAEKKVHEMVCSAMGGGRVNWDVLWHMINLEIWWRLFISGSLRPNLSILPCHHGVGVL